jgi:hypothetical protein
MERLPIAARREPTIAEFRDPCKAPTAIDDRGPLRVNLHHVGTSHACRFECKPACKPLYFSCQGPSPAPAGTRSDMPPREDPSLCYVHDFTAPIDLASMSAIASVARPAPAPAVARSSKKTRGRLAERHMRTAVADALERALLRRARVCAIRFRRGPWVRKLLAFDYRIEDVAQAGPRSAEGQDGLPGGRPFIAACSNSRFMSWALESAW